MSNSNYECKNCTYIVINNICYVYLWFVCIKPYPSNSELVVATSLPKAKMEFAVDAFNNRTANGVENPVSIAFKENGCITMRKGIENGVYCAYVSYPV